MLTRRLSILLATALAVLAAAMLLAALAASAAPAGPPAVFTWTDHFLTTTLDARWGWVREDNTHWSLSDRPGFMRLTTQQGGLLGGGNDAANLLLQAAPGGDFQIETHVTFTPTENFQIAGLLVYDDDDNFLMLGRAYCSAPSPACEGNAIYFDHEEQGNTVGGNFVMTTTSLNEAYLRLARDGDTYTGYYSPNGLDWTVIGAHTAISGMVPISVGVAAETSYQPTADIPADFDYFRLEVPLAETDPFSTTTLAAPWSWIREDNTHWSLSDHPGYMRITTQQGGLLGPGNDAYNLLVRNAPPGNFEIETRLLFTPTEDFQIAGLLVYDDDDNFLMLGRAHCSAAPPTCEGNAIYFDHEEDGNIVGGNYVMTTTALSEAYLRLARDGNTYTGFVSENGTDWTLVGAHTVISGVVPLKVGLAAEPSGTAAAEIPADFDYFILRIMERLVWLPALFR